jgi:hypothetical protein
MKKLSIFTVLAAFLGLVSTGILPGEVLADGDETLGTPSIYIEPGSGILAAGTGLLTQPGTINITIPPGVTIKQVLLYWEGIWEDIWEDIPNPNPQNKISVNGTIITGNLIGTGYEDRYCYRADITIKDLVIPGLNNSLSVNGLTFDTNNGAGVLVIIDDGFNAAEIDLRDGDDFAYASFDPPLFDTTVPQTFFFTPEDVDRTATLSMFFSSVRGTASGGGFRPTAIEVTVGGVMTVYNDLLDSVDGEEWDTLSLSVDIPAYTDSLTVQALSVDNTGGETRNPASFDWLVAALSVPHSGGEGCTPGYWKQRHHFDSWVTYDRDESFSGVFGPTITIRCGKKRRTEPNPTLRQALKAKGGGINALARHTVAALLNAASPDVSYDLFVDEVIDEFNAVYPGTKQEYNVLKDYFESFNEQGCPLN